MQMAAVDRIAGVPRFVQEQLDLRAEYSHAHREGVGTVDRDEGIGPANRVLQVPGNAAEVLRQEVHQGSQSHHSEVSDSHEEGRQDSNQLAQAKVA